MMRIAAYCRVSTDKEDQANSCETQQCYFRDCIERNPDWELQEIYADEGLSGTTTKKRKQFSNMIRAAREGKIDLIITKEVSRFARNTVDTLKYTRELRKQGIGVIFLNDNINSLDADGEFRLTIMASVAQEESRKTSTRVKWGQTRSMEQGVVFGGSLLGYDVINGKMRVNPEGAKTVRYIFHKYLNERRGSSIIAKELREEGILSSRGNLKWTATTVLKILKNEKYCGDLIQKKTYKIRCGECGNSFLARKKKNKSGIPHTVWRCGKATREGKLRISADGQETGCNVGRQIREDVAWEILKRSVRDVPIDPDYVIQNLSHIVADVLRNHQDDSAAEKRYLERELEGEREKKQRVLEEFLYRTISKADFQFLNQRCDNRITQISDQLIAIQERQSLDAWSKEKQEDICAAIRAIVKGECATDDFCGHLLHHMTVHGDGRIEVILHLLPVRWIYMLDIDQLNKVPDDGA